MKLKKVVVVVVLLLITVPLITVVVYAKNSTNNRTKGAIISNTPFSDSNDKLVLDSPTTTPTHLSAKDIDNIMHKIDSRVTKVKDLINYKYYKDHYDRVILMFRYFEHDFDQESSADYYLYYDEKGKLIYAEITHYRDAAYSIYFHNDELLHVEVGPFSEGGPSINGDMANVKDIINKDSSYAFVLEDISLCLEHAYK